MELGIYYFTIAIGIMKTSVLLLVLAEEVGWPGLQVTMIASKVMWLI